MSSKTVKYRVDLAKLPALGPRQKKEITALKALPDSTINYADLPPLHDAFWQNAVRNPLYKPVKTSTTVRVDSDVLHWLKAGGRGYQSRINAILRAAMLQQLGKV